MRRSLERREADLQAMWNREVRNTEEKLNRDVKTLQDEQAGYVEIFKELRTLGERFGKEESGND
jgi:hypothetical protein